MIEDNEKPKFMRLQNRIMQIDCIESIELNTDSEISHIRVNYTSGSYDHIQGTEEELSTLFHDLALSLT